LGYKLRYKSSVFKDLKHLDKDITIHIIQQLETELSENPNCSTPLKGQFKGLFKYRVGDYRVVYAKIDSEILILRIGHRKNIYKNK